jgi:hypothetical protein
MLPSHEPEDQLFMSIRPSKLSASPANFHPTLKIHGSAPPPGTGSLTPALAEPMDNTGLDGYMC